MALFFGVSIDYILGLDEVPTKNGISLISDQIGLPFYESFDEALLARESKELDQEIMVVSDLVLQEYQNHYFVIKVKTDSVNQLIPSGSNIIVLDFAVAEDKSLKTGDILIAEIQGKHQILSLQKTDLTIYLEPLSYIDGFETITLTTQEFEKLHIIGKVVASYQMFD